MKLHAITAPDAALAALAREVLAGFKLEHDSYYGQPHGYKRLTTPVHANVDGQDETFTSAGFTSFGEDAGAWISCAGNLLSLAIYPDDRVGIYIDAARHGIPTLRGAGDLLKRALPDPLPSDLRVRLYETHCQDAHPLHTDLYVPGLTEHAWEARYGADVAREWVATHAEATAASECPA